MRHYKTEEVITTRSMVIRTICDICKEEIKPPPLYQVEEITVERKTGNIYPEGGSGDYFRVDLCAKCFNNKLIPWLQSQGAEIQEEEWDY